MKTRRQIRRPRENSMPAAKFKPPAKKVHTMSDVTTAKPKTRPAGNGGNDLPKFEIPRFEMPKFEMPKMEVPAAFREFAEKGASQAKENYEKLKAAAEEATDVLEDTYATAAKGASEYGLKVIEA